jgi:hypothetical protein
MNNYTHAVKPESYDETLLDALNKRFSGFQQGVVLNPATVTPSTIVEPRQEYDKGGRPIGPAVDPRWNPQAQYKPAKKVLGATVVKKRGYGPGICEHCNKDYEKTKKGQRFCTKGGCQNASKQDSRTKREDERRAYRAAHPDCPHSVTVRKSSTSNRCQLCGRAVKIL